MIEHALSRKDVNSDVRRMRRRQRLNHERSAVVRSSVDALDGRVRVASSLACATLDGNFLFPTVSGVGKHALSSLL
jgi:hypothetical protein